MSKTSKGFIWSAVDRFSVQGFSFLFSIIIARLVSPSAYGLVAMTQVFLSFSQVFIDGGFSNALIQKKNRTETDFCTAFIFNFLIAIAIYLLLFATAPYIASFYEQPELVNILRILSLNLIFSSLSIVQRSRLTIDMDFKKQARAGISSVLISGTIGIICAYKGLGVWALVVQSVVSAFSQSFFLIMFSKWIPQWNFSKVSFKELFSFGSKLLAGNVLTSIVRNLSDLIVGKFYTAADLGFYNRSYTLAQYPSVNISSVMMRIIYPIECELQRDRERLLEAYYKYMHLSCYVIFPLMILLCVLAEPMLGVILTEKWVPAAQYLSIFSLMYCLYPYMDNMSQVVAAVGKSGFLLRGTVIKRTISVIIVLTAVHLGVKALVWGMLVSGIIEVFISAYQVSRVFSISIWSQIGKTVDIWISAVISGVAAYVMMICFDSYWMQLLAGGCAGLIAYIAFTFFLRLEERKILISMLEKLRH